MIGYKQITTTSFVLTAEGSMIVENGSHEYRVWEVLPAQGGVAMGIPDLKVHLGSCR
jgi:phenylalanyl-tRNA synthetase alpha chain